MLGFEQTKKIFFPLPVCNPASGASLEQHKNRCPLKRNVRFVLCALNKTPHFSSPFTSRTHLAKWGFFLYLLAISQVALLDPRCPMGLLCICQAFKQRGMRDDPFRRCQVHFTSTTTYHHYPFFVWNSCCLALCRCHLRLYW